MNQAAALLNSTGTNAMSGNRVLAGVALAGAMLAGCSAGGGQSGDAGGGPFIAFAGDFKGFHDWPNQAEATPSPALPAVDAGDHGRRRRSPRTRARVLEHEPALGSATFPIGTIIVKETEEADPTARHVSRWPSAGRLQLGRGPGLGVLRADEQGGRQRQRQVAGVRTDRPRRPTSTAAIRTSATIATGWPSATTSSSGAALQLASF